MAAPAQVEMTSDQDSAVIRPSKSAIQRRVDKLTRDRYEAERRARAAEERVGQLEARLGEAEDWRMTHLPAFGDHDRKVYEVRIIGLERTVVRSLNLIRQYREALKTHVR
jgi:hypothetical protein